MTLISYKSSGGDEGRCDAKCYNAKHPGCTCICGGKNHGVGLAQAQKNTGEMFHEWAEAWNQQHPDHTIAIPDNMRQMEFFPTHDTKNAQTL
jgi:hypothetical protein